MNYWETESWLLVQIPYKPPEIAYGSTWQDFELFTSVNIGLFYIKSEGGGKFLDRWEISPE